MDGGTIQFSIQDEKSQSIRAALRLVYDALEKQGYNPINQMVGYIISEDPTYITTHDGARRTISNIDRDDILQELLKSYLNV